MKRLLILFLFAFAHPSTAEAWENSRWSLSLGAHQIDEKVQNSSGSEAPDPFSPVLALGYDMDIGESFDFSPRLGYIKNTRATGDSFGGQKVETTYLLYDFRYFASRDWDFKPRFGFGSFIRRISGPGGTVTVPNGTTTVTAYRPGKVKQSAITSLNLGLDWAYPMSSGWVSAYGITGEIFLFEPMNSERRKSALQLFLAAYF